MKSPRALLWIFVAVALVTGVWTPARAHADTEIPRSLRGIDIEDLTGHDVPRDVKLRDQNGQDFTLGDRLGGGKPTLLLLAYYQCPMLCSMVINGLTTGMKEIALTAGADYRVLVVSFDGRDTVEIARAKRQAYLAVYGRPVAGDGWDFAVGDPAEVKRLADAVGFHYRWDAETDQFAHAAGAFVLTPDGRLSRTLYGMSFTGKLLELSLVEGAQGKIGGAVDRFLLFCFHYDPNVGSYVLATQRLMKAGGVVTIFGLLFWLIRLRRGERGRIVRAVEQRS